MTGVEEVEEEVSDESEEDSDDIIDDVIEEDDVEYPLIDVSVAPLHAARNERLTIRMVAGVMERIRKRGKTDQDSIRADEELASRISAILAAASGGKSICRFSPSRRCFSTSASRDCKVRGN